MENTLKIVLKEYKDFPKKGINFVDIHPLMLNHYARQLVVDHLIERYKDLKLDGIVCMESRGYYLGIPLAFALKIPFIPLRKAGKLPGKVHSSSFNKEYGSDTLEIQDGILPPGSRVVISGFFLYILIFSFKYLIIFYTLR